MESINATEQVDVDLHNFSNVKQLKNKWSEINLYRVVQEMLTNSIKYGNGCTVNVQLDYNDNELQIGFTDDGPGYDPEAEENQRGMGLGNISNR